MNWYQTDSNEDRDERLWACQSPESKFADMGERVESVKSFQEKTDLTTVKQTTNITEL